MFQPNFLPKANLGVTVNRSRIGTSIKTNQKVGLKKNVPKIRPNLPIVGWLICNPTGAKTVDGFHFCPQQ